MLVRVEAQDPLGGRDLLLAERGAVRRRGVLRVGGRPGDDGAHRDEGRAPGLGPRRLQRRVQGLGIQVPVLLLVHPLHVPAVGLVPLQGVLGEGGRRVALDGDVVVVPHDDQIAEPLVAGERGRLGRHALLQVAVAGDDPDRVVEGGVALGRLRVEEPPLVAGRHRHADRVGDALAQRAGRRLDARRVPVLGVPGGAAAPGAERLEVVQLQAVSGQEELDVLGQAGVARGEDEAVPARPVRIGRVVAHQLLVEQVRDGRQAHGRTGMAVTDLLHGIHGQDSNRVHGLLVQVGPLKICGGRLGAHPASGLLSTCSMAGVCALTGRCRAYLCRDVRLFDSSLCGRHGWSPFAPRPTAGSRPRTAGRPPGPRRATPEHHSQADVCSPDPPVGHDPVAAEAGSGGRRAPPEPPGGVRPGRSRRRRGARPPPGPPGRPGPGSSAVPGPRGQHGDPP